MKKLILLSVILCSCSGETMSERMERKNRAINDSTYHALTLSLIREGMSVDEAKEASGEADYKRRTNKD